jgi:hypothetical protein
VDANPLGTWSHLNSVNPGVKVGGPQTLGDSGVGGATAVIATTIATVVAVVLLLAELLRLLLLLLLLS